HGVSSLGTPALIRKRKVLRLRSQLATQVGRAAQNLSLRFRPAVLAKICMVACVSTDLEERVAAAQLPHIVPGHHQSRRLAPGSQLRFEIGQALSSFLV